MADPNVEKKKIRHLKKLTGGEGIRIFADTATHAISAVVIVPREDTVIEALSIDNTALVLGAANADSDWNIASVTLKSTDILTCGEDSLFTSIKLTSGSVIVYND